MAGPSDTTPRAFARPLIWAGLVVVVAALVVLTTRTGTDILAVVVAGFVLLLLERTVGDWVGENLGPVPSTLLFVGVAAMGVAYALTDDGRGRVRRFFTAAEARGYKTTYLSVQSGSARPIASGAAASAAGVVAGPVKGTPPVAASTPVPTTGTSGPPRGTPHPVGTAGAQPAPGTPSPSGASGAGPAPAGAMPGPGHPGPPASGVRLARVRLEPEVAHVGREVVLHAYLVYDRAGAMPAIEFSVDGRPIGTANPGTDGIAVARWKTMVPGQYVVRARVAESSGARGGASALLNVLPPQRRTPRVRNDP